MELKHIQTKKCPICGCNEVVGEYIETCHYKANTIKTHTNGGRWEHKRFLCGKEIIYDPNYRKEYTKGNCDNDPEYIALIRKQKEEKDKIYTFCEENGISKETINRLKHYLF